MSKEKIKYDKESVPSFKYHRDPVKTGAFFLNEEGKKCSCCDLVSKYIYEEPYYSAEEIDCLCPDCIKDGSAYKKFDVEFQPLDDFDDVAEDIIDEVSHRTPGYESEQEADWQKCCDDLCEFIGCFTTPELKKAKIKKEVFKAIKKNEYFQEEEDFSLKDLMEAVDDGEHTLAVFECLHCKKHKVDIGLS